MDYGINVNHDTGEVTLTPPSGFVGSFTVQVGVRGATTTTTLDPFDSQLVTVEVSAIGGLPAVDLSAGSDSGVSSTDNITNAASLDFTVSDVISGATVRLLKGTTILAEGVVPRTPLPFR